MLQNLPFFQQAAKIERADHFEQKMYVFLIYIKISNYLICIIMRLIHKNHLLEVVMKSKLLFMFTFILWLSSITFSLQTFAAKQGLNAEPISADCTGQNCGKEINNGGRNPKPR